MTADKMVTSGNLIEYEVYDNTGASSHPPGQTFWEQCAAHCQASDTACTGFWLFQSPGSADVPQNEVTCWIMEGTSTLGDWTSYHDLVAIEV